jgi:tripartite motif-containing protein 71
MNRLVRREPERERVMVFGAKCSAAPLLGLIVGLALLGCSEVSNASGTWTVISLPEKRGEVFFPSALAADPTGNLYVVEDIGSRIYRRDAQGNWSAIANPGSAVGQVSCPTALAADASGSLYVLDQASGGQVQKRDALGNWSVIVAHSASALAADAVGNLYLAQPGSFDGNCWTPGGILEQSAQQTESELDPGQVSFPFGLTVDPAGNLYVAEQSRFCAFDWQVGVDQIQRRDAQGNWSVVATPGSALGQVGHPRAVAVDAAGSLYVADISKDDQDEYSPRIQKRDAQGNWSVIATAGTEVGQVGDDTRLAVDGAGNLFVADPWNNRVQKYTPAL